jgi:hypothetical protein
MKCMNRVHLHGVMYQEFSVVMKLKGEMHKKNSKSRPQLNIQINNLAPLPLFSMTAFSDDIASTSTCTC